MLNAFSDLPTCFAAKVITDKLTKLSKCYGFVDFTSYDDYTKALALKGQMVLRDKLLIIK